MFTFVALEDLRELIEEAEQLDYPQTELFDSGMKVMIEAEKTSKIAKALIGTPAVRTRKGCASDMKYKCSIKELKLLSEEMSFLRVSLPEKPYTTGLYQKAKDLQEHAADFLRKDTVSIDDMANCIEESFIIDVEIEEMLQLRNVSCCCGLQLIIQYCWLGCFIYLLYVLPGRNI